MLSYYRYVVLHLRDNERVDLTRVASRGNRRAVGEQARVVFHERQASIVHVAQRV